MAWKGVMGAAVAAGAGHGLGRGDPGAALALVDRSGSVPMVLGALGVCAICAALVSTRRRRARREPGGCDADPPIDSVAEHPVPRFPDTVPFVWSATDGRLLCDRDALSELLSETADTENTNPESAYDWMRRLGHSDRRRLSRAVLRSRRSGEAIDVLLNENARPLRVRAWWERTATGEVVRGAVEDRQDVADMEAFHDLLVTRAERSEARLAAMAHEISRLEQEAAVATRKIAQAEEAHARTVTAARDLAELARRVERALALTDTVLDELDRELESPLADAISHGLVENRSEMRNALRLVRRIAERLEHAQADALVTPTGPGAAEQTRGSTTV